MPTKPRKPVKPIPRNLQARELVQPETVEIQPANLIDPAMTLTGNIGDYIIYRDDIVVTVLTAVQYNREYQDE